MADKILAQKERVLAWLLQLLRQLSAPSVRSTSSCSGSRVPRTDLDGQRDSENSPGVTLLQPPQIQPEAQHAEVGLSEEKPKAASCCEESRQFSRRKEGRKQVNWEPTGVSPRAFI